MKKTTIKKLTDAEARAALEGLDGWARADDGTAIRRRVKFKDFNQAFAFMTAVALKAEKMDHHPDWSNSYNVVDIALSTHSAGGLTVNDIELARFVNERLRGENLS